MCTLLPFYFTNQQLRLLIYLLYHANKKAYILASHMYASFLICQFKAYKFFLIFSVIAGTCAQPQQAMLPQVLRAPNFTANFYLCSHLFCCTFLFNASNALVYTLSISLLPLVCCTAASPPMSRHTLPSLSII